MHLIFGVAAATADLALALYDWLRELPLEVESYALERLEQAVSPEFTRVTTVVRLRGGGEEGVGEDVTYDGDDHDALQEPARSAARRLVHARLVLASTSDGLDLFPARARDGGYRDYRRWAFESAALDLALRQAGRSLAEALGREPRAGHLRRLDAASASRRRSSRVRGGSSSTRRCASSSTRRALERRAVAELRRAPARSTRSTSRASTRARSVDQPPDPRLYRRVAEGFPDAWIEDPDRDAETRPILEPHADRITWDAPIHSVADIEALPVPAADGQHQAVALRQRCSGSSTATTTATQQGIGAYGGGQFELGPGRGQIQYLASLFHPDAPNDVAPGGYNVPEPRPGLPTSPLEPQARADGLPLGRGYDRRRCLRPASQASPRCFWPSSCSPAWVGSAGCCTTAGCPVATTRWTSPSPTTAAAPQVSHGGMSGRTIEQLQGPAPARPTSGRP